MCTVIARVEIAILRVSPCKQEPQDYNFNADGTQTVVPLLLNLRTWDREGGKVLAVWGY